ncbi:MAG: hypothetical protein KAR42_00340 [candidate division Zixibacteria bacterium]|nr:hypothetical protein [candidate division Zixibacteria bacterium]
MKFDSQTYRLTDKGRFGSITLIVGIIGLILSCVGWFTDSQQFYFSYLTAFVFWLTIALGGLFFVLLHHLVGAKWSIVIRRFGESIMMVIPLMAILFIPLLFGLHELYLWMNSEVVASDHLLQGKSGYLNLNFFVVRAVLYFVIWTVLAFLLNKYSLQQNQNPSPEQIKKFRIISAPGMILFAVTLTFASFDWLMSLDAHWFSTIFGVYIFSGSFLSLLCVVTLVVIRLQSNGVLKEAITKEHYHDLGKLMFAFIIFWGYMAFSQYFLIWYGNIPEETIWFLHRWEGSWKSVSMLIVYGHFVIPFFVLFPQVTKRNKAVMTVMSIWILVMHWVDIYWLVMPTLHHHGYHLSWIDLATFIGIGGLFLHLFWRIFTAHPLVPVGDPNLEQSIKIVS